MTEREDLSGVAAHIRFRHGLYRCAFCLWSRDNSPGYTRESFQHILDEHPEWTTLDGVQKMGVARAAAAKARIARLAAQRKSP